MQLSGLKLLKLREVMQLTRKTRIWLLAHLDQFEAGRRVFAILQDGTIRYETVFSQRSVEAWLLTQFQPNASPLTAREICEAEAIR